MNYLKKTAIATAVAGSLGAGLALADDTVLFPYVSNGPTFTTLVSVINTTSRLFDTAYNRGTGTGYNRLHWIYAYKGGAAATDNLAPCSEIDYPLPTSKNDIQTVDLGAHFGATTLGVLFSDPSSNNNWKKAGDDGLTYAMASIPTKPNRGRLLVANADSDSAAQTIWGEAVSIEYGAGAAWGYEGLVNNGGDTRTPTTDGTQNDSPYDFSAAVHSARLSDVVSGGYGSPMAFMPPREVETRIYVTPLNLNSADIYFDGPSNGSMLKAGGVSLAGHYITKVSMLAGPSSLGVAYTRDEVLISGATPLPVRCVGVVRVRDMIDSYSDDVHPLRNGGWGRVRISHYNSDPVTRASNTYAEFMKDTQRAMAYKLEYNLGGNMNGEAITGTFNNGTDLRAVNGSAPSGQF